MLIKYHSKISTHIYIIDILEFKKAIEEKIKPKNELHAKRSRPFVRSLRIETPSEKVVEATAVIQKGIRGRGMGLRLEAENDRWRCTQLLVA